MLQQIFMFKMCCFVYRSFEGHFINFGAPSQFECFWLGENYLCVLLWMGELLSTFNSKATVHARCHWYVQKVGRVMHCRLTWNYQFSASFIGTVQVKFDPTNLIDRFVVCLHLTKSRWHATLFTINKTSPFIQFALPAQLRSSTTCYHTNK